MTTYQDRIPYTYLIGWTTLNVWYYGRRTKKGCHPTELWVKYFTSSVEVRNFRQNFGEPDVIEVRKIFTGQDCVSKCSEYEVKVIRRMHAVENPNWLNKGNAGSKFNTSGKVIARDMTTGKVLVVSGSDFNQLSDVAGINKGITFRSEPCSYCGISVAINNVSTHQTYCVENPARSMHPRTGVPMSDKSKRKMQMNHADVSGTKNPNSKTWKLTSPDGTEMIISGNLDSVLHSLNLSRFNLLKNAGHPVPDKNLRTSLSKRTAGWRLDRL